MKTRSLVLCLILVLLTIGLIRAGARSRVSAAPHHVKMWWSAPSELKSRAAAAALSSTPGSAVIVDFTISDAPPAKEYICPPCGCDSDGKVFDHPGACPSCGMELEEKQPAVPVSANATESTTTYVKSPWALDPPTAQDNTAAYMIVENRSATEINLVSASSDVAAAVELHTMETDSDGMMRMRRIERIALPANGSIELKPGGLHLMFIGLKREIKEGDQFSVTLFFSDSTKKTVAVPVKKRA